MKVTNTNKRLAREAVTNAHATAIHHIVSCLRCTEASYVFTMCGKGKSLASVSRAATARMETLYA